MYGGAHDVSVDLLDCCGYLWQIVSAALVTGWLKEQICSVESLIWGTLLLARSEVGKSFL